jgi:hypothetical protein
LGEFSPIGRFFAYWAIVYFGQFFVNCRISQLFSSVKVMHYFRPKIVLATVWATFYNIIWSPCHRVTLYRFLLVLLLAVVRKEKIGLFKKLPNPGANPTTFEIAATMPAL